MGTDLTSLWDFDDPAGSEARFRAAATRTNGTERLLALTQAARALGLQGRFGDGHALLDEVAAAGLVDPDPEVATRVALERGRLVRSAGEDLAAARASFEQAARLAEDAGLERLHLDALHMLALDVPPAESVERHLAALAVARTATAADARDWDASLLNNLGMAYHDLGDLPAALAAFEQALAARERIGSPTETRVARWMVGWTLRLLGRTAEALAVQSALRAELDAAGAQDPYVDEELALLTGVPGEETAR
ncbi:MAG: tetratricopeptide repeat protein [Nocardioidaceae bacterium]